LCTLSTLDLIVQLFICYICIKFGANDNLNRFDCCLVDDGNGGYQIKFILRQSVPAAIGVPHSANDVNDQDDDVMNESVDNEFTRTESLWRDRRRGMSLTNAKECNDIVRQFMEIDFDESMILSEMSGETKVPRDTSVNPEYLDVD
jgi:hypothetical protein